MEFQLLKIENYPCALASSLDKCLIRARPDMKRPLGCQRCMLFCILIFVTSIYRSFVNVYQLLLRSCIYIYIVSIYCQVFYRYEESYTFLTKYCGTWDPFSIVILSSKGAFRMISDSSYESKGFRAEFSAINEGAF